MAGRKISTPVGKGPAPGAMGARDTRVTPLGRPVTGLSAGAVDARGRGAGDPAAKAAAVPKDLGKLPSPATIGRSGLDPLLGNILQRSHAAVTELAKANKAGQGIKWSDLVKEQPIYPASENIHSVNMTNHGAKAHELMSNIAKHLDDTDSRGGIEPQPLYNGFILALAARNLAHTTVKSASEMTSGGQHTVHPRDYVEAAETLLGKANDMFTAWNASSAPEMPSVQPKGFAQPTAEERFGAAMNQWLGR